MDCGFRLDLLVERAVVVEIKSIDAPASIHSAQLLSYLRFSKVRLGYLINFNSVMLKNGLRRLVLQTLRVLRGPFVPFVTNQPSQSRYERPICIQ